MQVHGTLVTRKRKGKKLQFLMGCALTDLATLQSYINWTGVKASNSVVEFRGETQEGEPVHVSLVPLH